MKMYQKSPYILANFSYKFSHKIGEFKVIVNYGEKSFVEPSPD